MVFTKTNQIQELLGEFLFKMKKISEEIHSNIEEYIVPMKNIGKILVESGILTKKDLHAGLMYQMRETALNTFPIFGGKFKFQEKSGLTEGEFGTRINVPDLIEEGIRRMKYNPELKKFTERKKFVPAAKDCVERLTKAEKDLLALLDGSQTAAALLKAKRFRARPYWKSLYLFYCLNLIDLPEKAKPKEKKEKPKKVIPDDTAQRLAEVVSLSESLQNLDSYTLLNVPQTASQNEIKMAYFRLARKYHPDRFDQKLPVETKKMVENVFAHVSKAYQTLSTGKEPVAYEEPSPEAPSEVDKMEADKRAEIKFRQAKTLLTQERFDDALILIEEAARLKRNKASYILLLATIEMKIPTFREKAEEDFKKAIDLEPWNADAYAGLGMYYKEEGLSVRAKKMFRKALEIEPEHKVVRKELGLEEEIEKKKKTLKDLLAMDLLGKKKKKR